MMRNILLIVLFFSFIGGHVARIELGNNIAVNALDAVVLGFSVFALLSFIHTKKVKSLMQLSLFKPIAIFLVLCVVSLVVNIPRYTQGELTVSFLYTLRLVSYMLLFGYLMSQGSRVKLLLTRGLLFSGGIIVLLGYLQYFFYPYLGNLFYLGWDDHLGRMFSVFFDPNFAGCFFVLYSVFLLYLFRFEKSKKIRLVYAFLCAASILAVFLTFSRSAFMVLLVCAGLFGWFSVSKKIVLILLCFFVLLFFSFANFSIEGRNPFRVVSVNQRLKSMQNAVFLFEKHPLLGVGFNAYRYALQSYGLRIETHETPSHADSGSDNSYLFVLATTGLIGFMGFLTMIGNMLGKCYYSMRKNKHWLYVLVSLSALLVDAFFLNALFYPMLLFWVTASAAVMVQDSP